MTIINTTATTVLPSIISSQNSHKNFRAINNKKLISQVCQPVEQFDVNSFTQKYGLPFGFGSHLQNFIVENPDTAPRIVGVHSGNYGLVSNSEICQSVMEELNAKFGANSYFIKVRQFDGRQFEFSFVVDSIVNKVTERDEMYLKISVETSYDGVLKLSTKTGAYRMVCSNGLMAFDEELLNTRKHTSGFVFNMDSFENTIQKKVELVERFKAMNERVLTTKELEHAMDKLAVISPQAPKKLVEEAFLSTIENEALALEVKPNLWLAYNSFNRIINHELNKASHTPAFKEKLDKQALDFLVQEFAYN